MDKKNTINLNYNNLLSISLIVLLCLFFFLGAFKTIVHEPSFYAAEYEKLGVYERYGKEFVDSTTDNLFSYIREGTPLTGFFSDRDKEHMIDVKELINKTFVVYWVVVVLIAILFLIAYKADKKEFMNFISKTFIKAGFAMLALVLIAFLLSSQFSSIFIGFHKIFFDNDLWLLDPAKDNLINLYPEQFFFDFTGNMVIGAVASAVMLAVLGAVVQFWLKKKKK